MRAQNLVFDRMLRDNGWELVRNSKHRIWRCGCGEHQLSLAHAPDGDHAVQMLRSLLRRCGSKAGL